MWLNGTAMWLAALMRDFQCPSISQLDLISELHHGEGDNIKLKGSLSTWLTVL